MQKHIFIVTTPNGTKTAHSAILSFLEHPEGVPISRNQFRLISKVSGYPVTYKGYTVEKIPLFSTTESRKLEFKSRAL